MRIGTGLSVSSLAVGRSDPLASYSVMLDFKKGRYKLGGKTVSSPMRTNLCAVQNVNPTVAFGISTVVDDVAALDAAGLSSLCTNGKVYKADNSLGSSTTYVIVNGETISGGAAHTLSVYARAEGAASSLCFTTTGSSPKTIPVGLPYARYTSTATNQHGNRLQINVAPGAVLYFILFQLEAGSVATDPITVSGAARAVGGVTDLPGYTFSRASGGYAETSTGALIWFPTNVPRITDKGFLSEEGRTNYVLNSSDSAQNLGSVSGSTTTSDYAPAPDGSPNGDRIALASDSYHYKRWATTNTGMMVGSVYLRATSGAQSVILRIANTTGAQATAQTVNLTTAWQRYFVTLNVTSTTYMELGLDTRTMVGGDGAAKDVVAWGWQIEMGAYPTSHMPTTVSAVTRPADSLTFPSAPATGDFTFFGQAIAPLSGSTHAALGSLDDGTSAPAARLEFARTNTNGARVTAADGGVLIADVTGPGNLTTGVDVRMGASHLNGKIATYVGGTLSAYSAADWTGSAITRMTVGSRYSTTALLNSYLTKLLIKPRASTQAEMDRF